MKTLSNNNYRVPKINKKIDFMNFLARNLPLLNNLSAVSKRKA